MVATIIRRHLLVKVKIRRRLGDSARLFNCLLRISAVVLLAAEHIFLLSIFHVELCGWTGTHQGCHLEFLAVRAKSIQTALYLIRIKWLPPRRRRLLRIILDASEIDIALVLLIVVRNHLSVELFQDIFWKL